MNFILENWVLVLAAVTSGGLLLFPALLQRGGGATSVGTAEAVRLINRERGVLVDVAEPAEYAAGHAIGARNVPFGEIPNAKALPTNKTVPLLVLCPTGARAGRAVALLRKAGWEKAVSVAGGTAAWREASLPVERSADEADKGERPDKADKADKADRGGKADKVAKAVEKTGAGKA